MSDTPQQGGALAVRGPIVGELVVPEKIINPVEFKQHLATWTQQGYHVLTPQADFGSLPPQWKIVPTVLALDPNPNAGDVYQDRLFCKNDEVAPTKVALRKIARSAGISYETFRTDSNTVMFYWAAKCRIEYWGFDGQRKFAEASYEWDLRDGTPRATSMTAKELPRARTNGWRRCEAGAINAAIREYGLKQKYTIAELRKPFVVLNMVFDIDPTDVVQRRIQAQSVMGAKGLLYAGDEPKPSPMGEGAVVASTGERFAPQEAEGKEVPFDEPDAPAEEEDDALTLKVIGVTKVVDTDDYFVTTEDGRRLHTSDKGVASACNAARKAGTPLAINTDANEILEIKAPK